MHTIGTTSTYFHRVPLSTLGGLVDSVGQKIAEPEENMEAGRFIHNGFATNYYVSRAMGREKFIVIGFSGANAQFPLNFAEIKYLNNAGATMICMALPHVGNNFMERSESLARAFLTKSKSPASLYIRSDAPQFIVTHSSSGPILLKLLGEELTRRSIASRTTDIAMMSPIFDIPYASRDHSWGTPSFKIGPLKIPSFRPLHHVFAKYADRNADIGFKMLPMVKAYLALTAKTEDLLNRAHLPHMTMGHLRDIQQYAHNVIDGFVPSHTRQFNMMVMAGSADFCTSWRAARSTAQKIGAQFHLIVGARHDIIKNNPEVLDMLIDQALKRIKVHEGIKAITPTFGL